MNNEPSTNNQPSMNNQPSILTDIELDVVTGGQSTAESIVRNSNGTKTVKNDIVIRP